MGYIELMRITLGFLFAPILGLALFGVGSCAVPVDGSGGGNFSSCWDGGNAILQAVGIGLVFAYPATLVFGLPLFLVFRRLRWLAWWQISMGGLMVGGLATLVMALFTASTFEGLFYGLLFCPVALAAGFTFWLIAVCRHRPLTLLGADAQNAARRST